MESVLDTPSGRAVLEVANLHVECTDQAQNDPVLVNVSLELKAGEVAAVFGEGDSGASVLAQAVSGHLPTDLFKVSGGSVRVADGDAMDRTVIASGRQQGTAKGMTYVGSGPAGKGGHLLDPDRTIEKQMARRIQAQLPVDRTEASLIAEQLLRDMGFAEPGEVLAAHPGLMSPEIQWRVVVGTAFAANPRVIIADDPGAGLDAAARLLVLSLLKAKAEQSGTAVLLTGGDLPLFAGVSDRAYILYCGRIVEMGQAEDVLHEPLHPFTRALLAALPGRSPSKSILPLPEAPDDNWSFQPGGCVYRSRCAEGGDDCAEVPHFSDSPGTPGQGVACWRRLAGGNP